MVGCGRSSAEVLAGGGAQEGTEKRSLFFPQAYHDAWERYGERPMGRLGEKDGKPAIFFSENEMEYLAASCKLFLIGKSLYGHPKLKLIRKAFDALKLVGSWKVGHLDRRHILIQLTREEDNALLFAKKMLRIENKTIELLKWSVDFDVRTEEPHIDPARHDELESKFYAERAALEAKYQKLYDPLYTKRYEIVNGLVDVEFVADESVEATGAKDKTNEGKGVPDFWLTALKTNEVVFEKIHERDEDALKHLNDIRCSKLDDPKGFKLEFFFNPNPYFKNSVLSRTYHVIDDDNPFVENTFGTEIEWFPGKCLTKKVLKKKPKKGSKKRKPITKTEVCESFFNFFSPKVPEDCDDIDVAEPLQNQLEQDYDIVSAIRDEIIPHAVSWFTGEAIKEEFDGIRDEEDNEDEDEDDEEEDEDDDEDKEVEEVNAKKKSAADRKKDGEVAAS